MGGRDEAWLSLHMSSTIQQLEFTNRNGIRLRNSGTLSWSSVASFASSGFEWLSALSPPVANIGCLPKMRAVLQATGEGRKPRGASRHTSQSLPEADSSLSSHLRPSSSPRHTKTSLAGRAPAPDHHTDIRREISPRFLGPLE